MIVVILLPLHKINMHDGTWNVAFSKVKVI